MNQDDEKQRLLGRAWGHAQLKMFENAVKDCEALVGLDKDDPSSYVELGYYYEKSGRLDQTIECYRYLMGRFPEYSVAYSNLGYIYQTHKKRLDLAIPLYQKALELNPADTWALNNVGTVLQAEGKWEEALSYYEKAAGSAGTLEEERACQILHNLGWACYRCKKYEEARRVFACLAQMASENASVYSDFGCVFYKLGRFREALDSFDAALQLCPGSRYYKKLWKVANRKRK
ncbi:MAG: tetratricopeptide repeat protein [Candidatus Omnitrophota bacterium]